MTADLAAAPGLAGAEVPFDFAATPGVLPKDVAPLAVEKFLPDRRQRTTRKVSVAMV